MTVLSDRGQEPLGGLGRQPAAIGDHARRRSSRGAAAVTALAASALVKAGYPADDPVVKKALTFVEKYRFSSACETEDAAVVR